MKKNLILMLLALESSATVFAAPACAPGALLSTSSAVLGATISTSPSTFSCSVDGFTFSNFQMVISSPNDTGSSLFIDIVSVLSGGLVFGTDLASGQDVQFEYELTPGTRAMTLFNGGAPNSTITELICGGPVLVAQGGNGSNCDGSTTFANFGAAAGQSVSVTLGANPVDWVFKDISGGNINGSGISEFSQVLIPEPAGLSLLGVGLLGIGLFRRRARR